MTFFSPFLGLEEAFGTGFTSGSIADAIRVAEQEGSNVFDFGVFAVDGVSAGNLAFDVFQGLFLVSDPITGQILHQGATVEALNQAIADSRALGLPGPPGPAGPAGTGVDVASVGAAIRNILASLQRAPTTGGVPGPVPEGLGERVLPGGTVNQPVVLGSTGDPGGVRRPRFPDDREGTVEAAQKIGQLIREILAARAAQRAQERALEKQAANQQAWINFLLSLTGGQPMPFGQAGFSAGNGGRDFLTDLVAAAGGFLRQQFGPSQGPVATTLPQFPEPPRQGPLLETGGGGGCPPLFRSGAPAGMRVSPVPWFPVQAPNGKWFFFGHLGTPSFSKLKARRRPHHHHRKR